MPRIRSRKLHCGVYRINRPYHIDSQISHGGGNCGIRWDYRPRHHLFAQLEKLGDDDLKGDELDAEIRRSEAMAKVGEQIIKTGELQLKALQHMDEYGYDRKKIVPEMLEIRGGV